jgi:hypothetical protein
MFVKGTIDAHPDVSDLHGEFIGTENGTSFEVWLGHLLERTVAYETGTYDVQRPVSFVNWPTTDKIEHPYEPFYHEDLVSIDPDKVIPTWKMVPGLFATYHVYPYYPDLMTQEPAYANYVNREGYRDNYAGYLNDLERTHSLPVLIGEYGVPSSRGTAHEGLYGMDHGHHTEQEQGEIVSHLFQDIVSEGLAGGIVFSWQDEWFKRTWNTMDLTEPLRRPLWKDVQTCEQHFGLLSFDPASAGVRTIDGLEGDWDPVSTIRFEDDNGPLNVLEDGSDPERTIRGLLLSHDEAYLNIGIGTGSERGIDWDSTNILILIDILDGQGSRSVPFGTGLSSECGFDIMVHIKGVEGSQVLVHSYYDLQYFKYGHKLGYMDELPYAITNDNGMFNEMTLTVNNGFRVPATGKVVPFKAFDTGTLRWGCSDPGSELYDSLTDIAASDDGSFIELRLPYLLLNFRDPSKRMVNGDPWTEGLGSGRTIEGIRLAVVTFRPGEDGNASGTDRPLKVTDSLPRPVDATLMRDTLPFYTWSTWEEPEYKERLKASYFKVRDAFS